MEVVAQKLEDINFAEEVRLPFRAEPIGEHSDALDDFYKRISEWVNYICEVLLLSDLRSNKPFNDYSAVPQIKDTSFFKKKSNSHLPAPKILVAGKNIDSISRNLFEKLYYHSISQLVTNYEIFLNELTTDLFWRNLELLAIKEKQLDTYDIFELGSLENIQEVLIERKVIEHAMSSYPKRVEKFQEIFHVGFHSKRSPCKIYEIHDLIEVRHVIQHNDGYGSVHYLGRMKVYNEDNYSPIISGLHSSPKIDFVWLLNFGEKMLRLAEYIDLEASSKWNTTRNSDI